MTWPVDDLSQQYTDQGTDDPSQARVEINKSIGHLKTIIAARGQVDGIASLDASGKVPSSQLPQVGDSAATPNTTVLRDSAARAQMADPVSAQDIATKNYADTKAAKAGDTFTGNVTISRTTGDVEFKFEAQELPTTNYRELYVIKPRSSGNEDRWILRLRRPSDGDTQDIYFDAQSAKMQVPGMMELRHTMPIIQTYETDAALNEKYWRFIQSGSDLHLQTVDDAYTTGIDCIVFNRAGLGNNSSITVVRDINCLNNLRRNGLDVVTRGGGAQVGVNELKLATGSFTGRYGDFAVHQYAFASPSFVSSSSGMPQGAFIIHQAHGEVDPRDVLTRHWVVENTDGSPPVYYTVTWDYITNSENSRLYVRYDPTTGKILEVWEAEDPVDEDDDMVPPIPGSNVIEITDLCIDPSLIHQGKRWLDSAQKPAWMARSSRFKGLDGAQAKTSFLARELEKKRLPCVPIDELIADRTIDHNILRWRAHMWWRCVANLVHDQKIPFSAFLQQRFTYDSQHHSLVVQ